MQLPSKYFQDIRLLQILIKYADSDLNIDCKNKEMWEELSKIFSNGNLLDNRLYELDKKGIIFYRELGEDGFAPIIVASINKNTHSFLSLLLEQAETEVKNLECTVKELLTFDPNLLTQNIQKAQKDLEAAKQAAQDSDLLKSLLNPIKEIESHFKSVVTVTQVYDDVYKNIIRPIQKEGEAGVKQTVKWAIISIVVSTILSVVISSWTTLSKMIY